MDLLGGMDGAGASNAPVGNLLDAGIDLLGGGGPVQA